MADTQGAIKLLQKVATLEPENKAVQSDLARLFIKARREEHNEKEMYQKMLGQAKKMEQTTTVRQKTPLVDNSKVYSENELYILYIYIIINHFKLFSLNCLVS